MVLGDTAVLSVTMAYRRILR